MGRANPARHQQLRQIKSTEDMAGFAKDSGYHNVSADLQNLADRRRTAAGMPPMPRGKYGTKTKRPKATR